MYAKSVAIQYVDWLVTTINSDIPQVTWRANPHPCTLKFGDINPLALDADYQSLVNSVQRHTLCNAAYCLRRKNGAEEATCRFGYPIECSSDTTSHLKNYPMGKLKYCKK